VVLANYLEKGLLLYGFLVGHACEQPGNFRIEAYFPGQASKKPFRTMRLLAASVGQVVTLPTAKVPGPGGRCNFPARWLHVNPSMISGQVNQQRLPLKFVGLVCR
jgi:hypothetical protein